MVIQYVLLTFFAIALGLTLRRARQGAMSRVAAFLWSALWIGAAFVVLRPSLATSFAGFLGVGRGVDAVLYVAIIALFYLVFRIFLRLDKIERDITLLVRRQSLEKRGSTVEKE